MLHKEWTYLQIKEQKIIYDWYQFSSSIVGGNVLPRWLIKSYLE